MIAAAVTLRPETVNAAADGAFAAASAELNEIEIDAPSPVIAAYRGAVAAASRNGWRSICAALRDESAVA